MARTSKKPKKKNGGRGIEGSPYNWSVLNSTWVVLGMQTSDVDCRHHLLLRPHAYSQCNEENYYTLHMGKFTTGHLNTRTEIAIGE